MPRTPVGAFIHGEGRNLAGRRVEQMDLVGQAWRDDDLPGLGVAGPPVGPAADILNRGKFPARRAEVGGANIPPVLPEPIGDNMPHINGQPHKDDRDPWAPVDVAGGGLDLGVPEQVPGGPRGDRFPTLQEEIGIQDLRIGEVPMAEADFNLRRRLDAERRREQGLGVLQDALNQIGSSEGEIAAREVALQRLRGGGLGAGALRGQLAASQESALRQQAEQFAQRGLGGGVPAVAMMQAQRMGAIGAAGTEAAFRENLQRSALQDIQAMNQEVGQRRLAAQDLLQRYLGEYELPPVDFSGMVIKPEDAMLGVGGILPEQGVQGEGPVVPARDVGDRETWEDLGDGELRVPEGHEFAGCRYHPGAFGELPARYTCPNGHPRNAEAGEQIHLVDQPDDEGVGAPPPIIM